MNLNINILLALLIMIYKFFMNNNDNLFDKLSSRFKNLIWFYNDLHIFKGNSS